MPLHLVPFVYLICNPTLLFDINFGDLCFVLCLWFMFAFVIFHNIYFKFLLARSIKPTSTCFQVLSGFPTQAGVGDGVRVCLLTGGLLDCSQSSICP